MSNLFPATHGIDGYSTPLDLHEFEKFRDRGDFVGFVFSFHLAQGEAVFGRPDTDHVNGGFVGRTTVGSA